MKGQLVLCIASLPSDSETQEISGGAPQGEVRRCGWKVKRYEVVAGKHLRHMYAPSYNNLSGAQLRHRFDVLPKSPACLLKSELIFIAVSWALSAQR